MKIYASVGSPILDGLSSCCRGEDNWIRSWVRFLAWSGHEVFCESHINPKWGCEFPIPNVHLCEPTGKPDLETEYDVYITSSAMPTHPENIKAKMYIYLVYHLHDNQKELIESGDNHVLGYIYDHMRSVYLGKGIDDPYFMPIPICEKWGSSNFGKKEFTWTVRGNDVLQYHGSMRNAAEAIAEILELTVATAKKYNCNYNFLLADSLSSGWQDEKVVKLIKRHNIEKIISEAPNVAIYNYIPLTALKGMLERTTLTVCPVATNSGCQIDSIRAGALPTIYCNSLLHDAVVKHHCSFDLDFPKIMFEEYLEHVINDEKFYNTLLKSCQEHLKEHLYENCQKWWDKITERIR